MPCTRQVMGMSDCDRQRIRRVCTHNLYARKQAGDHGVDLVLAGATGADHRFLDQGRRILAHLQAGPGGAHQRHSARMGELQRGGGVLVDEHLLGGGGLRLVLGDQRLQCLRQLRQPTGERVGGTGLDLAVGEVGDAVAFRANNAPPGRGQGGVQAQDDQPSRSATSSGIW